MKILLLGANGQVGFELARSLAPLGDLFVATRGGLLATRQSCLKVDLSDPTELDAALHKVVPDIVVNAAAYTAVDRAENEENLAERINHWALAVIGAWSARSGALVVHYSTDYVFDGQATSPYREDDTTAPLGVYGRSKLAGEEALRNSGCEHLMFRTAWVYAARGGNFLRTMLRLARERDELRVVDDQRGAPTSARLIAAATAAALVRWMDMDSTPRQAATGTYHLCAGGECTWYEFARSIFTVAQRCGLLDRVPALVPIASADYPTPARRPAYSLLDTEKFRATFGLHLPDWGRTLECVLEELVAMKH